MTLKDDSTKLTYSANLHDLTITGVPGGTPALTLDWSQMTTNGLGRPFTAGVVTSAIVGHYTQTPAQLEAQFLDLDRIATATYRADIDRPDRSSISAPSRTQTARAFPVLMTAGPGWSGSPAATAEIRPPGT